MTTITTTTRQSFIECYLDEHRHPAPWHWEICSTCRGHGTSTAYLGDVTEMIREDPDFGDDYRTGLYDRTCESCDGRGMVQEFDGDAADEWAEWVREAYEDAAIRRAESGYY
jgi:hypothetical protein